MARILKYGRINPNTKDYWNRKYSNGIYQDVEIQKYKKLRGKIVEVVPRQSKILDLGCGTGYLMELLQREQRCACTGVDISNVSVLMVKEKGCEAYQCRAPAFPNELRGAKFDVCTMTEVLEHLKYPDTTLRNLTDYLRLGGTVIASVPNDSLSPKEFDEHLQCFNRKTLQNLFCKYFEVEKCIEIDSDNNSFLLIIACHNKK